MTDQTINTNHLEILEKATGICYRGDEQGLKGQLDFIQEIISELSDSELRKASITILANLYLGRRMLMGMAGNL